MNNFKISKSITNRQDESLKAYFRDISCKPMVSPEEEIKLAKRVKEGDEEVPFFHPKFLIMKYLKMSEADLELNEKIKREEKLKAEAEGGGESEGDEGGEGGGDDLLGGGDEGSEGSEGGEGGGEESPEKDNGGDIDSEMLGDVQPESTETTQA